ncbi:MAG: pectin acetylesterase-family hydrolase [Polyangiales bacterium]
MRFGNPALIVLFVLFIGCGETGGTDGSDTGGVAGTGGTSGTAGAGAIGGAGGQMISISDSIANPRILTRRVVRDAASRDAVCNDGTEAVYYFEAESESAQGKWIILLQGGGGCANPERCMERAQDEPHLTSSTDAPETIELNGILAADAELNADFFDWNAVQIKYCSSDNWHGSKAATEEPGGFHFRGHDIIGAVLEDLQSESDFGSDHLGNATKVILAGVSAGANGVKHNLDRVAKLLSWADVRGLVDSEFHDRVVLGYPPAEETDFSERIAYQGLVPDASCAADELDPNICGSGMHVVLHHVTTPFFVVMDQSDFVVFGAAVDQTPERAAAFAESVRKLVQDHGAGFSSRTGRHGWMLDSMAYRYEIDGTSPLDSFANWYFDRPGPKLVVQEP